MVLRLRSKYKFLFQNGINFVPNLLKLFLLIVACKFLEGVRAGKLVASGLVEPYHSIYKLLRGCDG
jgi:hypothetical protein